MKLRQALFRDVPKIASIGTLAFAGDPSYEHFFPRRSQYPNDFYAYLLHEHKRMLEFDIIDGQAEKRKGGRGKLVVFATFVRSGGTAEELARWNSDSTTKSMLQSLLFTLFLIAKMER